MLLTIVTCGKNDDYCGNFKQRLTNNITKLVDNIQKSGKNSVEIIVTDWGSEIPLSDVLDIKSEYVKFLNVSTEIVSKYNDQTPFSIPHSFNTAVRRSSGDFIFYIDGDAFIPYESYVKLYELIESNLDNDIFYWSARYEIPYKLHCDSTCFQDIDNEIEKWLESGKTTWERPNHVGAGPLRSNVDVNNFGGGAMGLLVSRRISIESTGWWEVFNRWGYMDIELHHRLSSRFKCNGELEATINSEFYHQNHWELNSGLNTYGANPAVISQTFEANGDNWGLGIEDIKIVINK